MKEMQIVLFQLEQQQYGINIAVVESISQFKDFKLVKIPNTEAYMEGIINLRGSVILLYNLSKKFQFKESSIARDSEILIVSSNGIKIGFIVDRVVDIIKLKQEDIDLANNLFKQINDEYISGIGKHEGEMIIILDVAKILTFDERKELIPLTEKTV